MEWVGKRSRPLQERVGIYKGKVRVAERVGSEKERDNEIVG